MNHQRQEAALNYDGGKARYDLIPADALEEIAKVYTMGAEKYADRNWEAGMSWSRAFGSLMRHAWAWMAGEDYDKESGIHHMSHAAFRCLQIISYQFRQIGTDDRPTLKAQKEGPKRIYLAIPYSGMEEQSFEASCRIAAKLMNEGHIVFSPIAHSHPLVAHGAPQGDHDFWMKQDLAVLEHCDEMHIVCLDGWRESRGVGVEIVFAREHNIPIELIDEAGEVIES